MNDRFSFDMFEDSTQFIKNGLFIQFFGSDSLSFAIWQLDSSNQLLQ